MALAQDVSMTVLLLVLAGLMALVLTRPAQQRQLWGRLLRPAVIWSVRVAAMGVLAAAAALAVQSLGWVIGLALWCGGVTAGAALCTFSLPWLARALYNRRI